jgi:hypothetical protein
MQFSGEIELPARAGNYLNHRAWSDFFWRF